MFLIISYILSGVISVLISLYLKNKYDEYKLTNKHLMFIFILGVIFNIVLNLKLYVNYKSIESNIFSSLILNILLTVVASCLASSFMIDALFKELPDENNLIMGVSLFIVSLITLDYKVILTAIFIFIIFFTMSIVTNQFGMGDVKMMTMMGLGFNFDKILSFIFLSFLLASIYSLFKILFRKNKNNNIAFGPFLIISFLMI